MRILVTGGEGFIGSYLCQALIQETGITVASMDYSPSTLYHSRQTPDGILHINQNILDYESLKMDFDNFRPHLVYHLAAKLGVQDVMDKPGETVSENVLGTLHISKLCQSYGSHLIFASTSDVYGTSSDLPFRESGMLSIGPSVEPRWSYAISKLAGEHLTLANGGTVIRFFNVTGPGQKEKYVVPIMVGQALRGEQITVYGDGSSTRCFADVRDVVKALVAFVDITEQVGGEIYNIGSNKSISMWELAEVVRQYVNPNAEIKMVEFSEGYTEMYWRIPDLRKIEGLLGWKCEIRLKQMIEDIAEWHTK